MEKPTLDEAKSPQKAVDSPAVLAAMELHKENSKAWLEKKILSEALILANRGGSVQTLVDYAKKYEKIINHEATFRS